MRQLMVIAWAAVLGALAAAPAAHAAAQVPTLDRVDSLMTAGNYADARADLDLWWSARTRFDVPGSDRARALMLRAQLSTDAAAAESDYLAVALGHPSSPHAPDALLRLGQALFASGQPERAAGYLQRLAADYPGRPQRTTGLLWLARAQSAVGRHAAACRAAREGALDARQTPDLAAMFRAEESVACSAAPAEDPQPTTTPPATDPPPAAAVDPVSAPPPTRREEPAATGSFAAQTGAFRYQRSVDTLLEKLRDAGYEPRVVRVPRNDLLRVRVGRFATSDEAARVVARLKADGFDAVVVSDADEERGT